MRRSFYAGILLWSGVLAMSCQKDFTENNLDTSCQENLSTVNFQTSVEKTVTSKAVDTYFEIGDQIGIYSTLYSDNAPMPLVASGNHADNKLYTYGTNGFSSESPIKSDITLKYDYIAYYPYMDTPGDPQQMEFSVKTDQSIEVNLKASDLIYARTAAIGENVELKFCHKMNRVKLLLSTPEPIVSATNLNATITGLKNSAIINLDQFGIEPQVGSEANITLFCKTTTFPASEIELEAFVIPQTFSPGENLIEVVVDNRMFVYAPTQEIVFSSGKIREIQLDLVSGTEIKAIIIPEMIDYLPTGTAKMSVKKEGEPSITEINVKIDVEQNGTKITLMENIANGHYELVSMVYASESFPLDISSDINLGDNVVNIPWNAELGCFGDGSEQSPFRINSKTTFEKIRSMIASMNNFAGKFLLQTRDIDLELSSDKTTNATIGTDTAPFAGVYDGGGFSIKNFHFARKNKWGNGLFGGIGGTEQFRAVVKNLTVEGSLLANSWNNPCTGGIVGIAYDYSDIENCHNYVEIIDSRGRWIGGVLGAAFCDQASKEDLNLDVTKTNYTIKQVKRSTITVTDCTNHARIQVDGQGYMAGGIVGFANCKIVRCANYGDYETIKPAYGGIAGVLYGEIEESFNAGDIIAASNNNSFDYGGLVGVIWNDSKIKNCYNSGMLDVANNYWGNGGLVGVAIKDVSGWVVENCYNIGKVSEGGAAIAGGVFSRFSDKSTTPNSSDSWPFPAGTDAADYFVSTYYASNHSTAAYNGLIANEVVPKLTVQQAMSQASYAGWDFSSIWAIDEGSSTPYLQNNMPETKPSVN